MQMLVIGAVLVVMALLGKGVAPWLSPWPVVAAASAGYVLAAFLAARLAALTARRDLLRRPGGGRRRHRLAAAMLQVYLLGGTAGLMALGLGEWLLVALHLQAAPMLAALPALGPFAAALLAYWWGHYPLDRALRTHMQAELALAGERALPVWSCRQYLAFHVRHDLLFVAAPAAAIVVIVSLLDRTEGFLSAEAAGGLALLASAGIFTAAPWMIVRIWRTRPLPPGPLRDRLEGFCRRVGLRYRQILLWDTGGTLVNAGVMGLLRPVRYILLSDALVERLDGPAIESVFAHEAGHVVHHHIPYMAIFTAAVLTLAGSAVEGLGRATHLPADLRDALSLAVSVSLWLWLFGRLSRLFERQSDLFAAATVPADGPHWPHLTPAGVCQFALALLAVGRLNGVGPTRPNYRHGSIQRRLDFLAGLLAQGAGHRPTDRKVARVKAALWVLLGAGLAGAWLAR